MIITIDVTDEENARIDYLRDQIGVRTAPDLLMFLVNEKYKSAKAQEAFSKDPGTFAKAFTPMMEHMFRPKEENK